MSRPATGAAALAALALLGAAALFGGASTASATTASGLPTLGCVVEPSTGGYVYAAFRRPKTCVSQSAASFRQYGMQLYSFVQTDLGEMRWSSWTAKTAHGKGLLEGNMGGPRPIEVWLSAPVRRCPPGVVAPQTERTFSRMLTKVKAGTETITNLSVLPLGVCQAKILGG